MAASRLKALKRPATLLFATILSAVGLCGCGSFGQGLLMGLSNLGSPYSTGYGWGNSYVSSYISGNSSASSQSSSSSAGSSSSSASVSPQYNNYSSSNIWSTAPTYVATPTTPTTTYSGSSTGSSSTSSSTSSGYKKTCHLCHGLKKCFTCNGNRSFINPLTGKYVSCPNCTNGLCSHCHGTGLN